MTATTHMQKGDLGSAPADTHGAISKLSDVAEAIRLGPAAAAVFVAGLVALAVAGVLLAVRDGVVALPFALGMVAFLPQFFAGPEVRIAKRRAPRRRAPAPGVAGEPVLTTRPAPARGIARA